MTQHRRTRAAVVVLGDIGRSPRMQYHALALADAGAEVALIGIAGHPPFAAVRDHPRIRQHPLRDAGRPPDGTAFLLRALVRAVRHTFALLGALVRRPVPDVILVQSPPAIPTLAVALLAARLGGARLVVDWHNFGFAMLAIRLRPAHAAVRLTAWGEGACGRRADAHLCVSRALQRALAERWGIAATVLYDRPARHFAPLPADRRAHVVRELCLRVGWQPEGPPLVVVSPTSWTADEDFALLLEALAECEARLAAQPGPPLLVVLTGTGPLRREYEARLAHLPGARVHAYALWLPADDYAAVLAAADLGLSLHRSASGVDLPMKIADMFGAGVPVCALDYGTCLREILRPGNNALLFTSAGELAAQLCDLARGSTASAATLDGLRAGAVAAAGERWEDAWAAHAAPALLGDSGRRVREQ
jgi:beta-1,4-mannosyltransferase